MDPKRVGWNPYSYVEGNPILLIDEKGENPLLVAMLVNGLVSAGIDLGMQYAASGGDWDKVQWGSVGASFASGALTTGAMGAIAKAGGALAANTFQAMMTRSLISNAIDLTCHSVGLAADAKKHNLDYGKEWGKMALSNAVNVGFDAAEGLGNRYLMNNSWDPNFDNFKKRMTEYDSPWMKRWDPGSLQQGWDISNPRDYFMTTSQRSVITFTVIEIYYMQIEEEKQADDGTIYIPQRRD